MNGSNVIKIKVFLLLIIFVFLKANAQELVVKTNMPYLLTATPNIGVEYIFTDKMSFELTVGFNPFLFKDSKRIKHLIVWPELRYWTYKSFSGHFFGVHGIGGIYNISGWDLGLEKLSKLKNNRIQGSAYGAGISYGYHWIVNSRWAIELSAGVGMASFKYDSYSLTEDGYLNGMGNRNYFGPTKGGFSLIYLIK